MTPNLYALRCNKASVVGVVVAAAGALLEAIADGQKFVVKQKYGNSNIFCGPTGGVYRICRHPNYLGEVVFWLGMYVSGVGAFGKSIAAWVCSSLGLYGICGIMKNATARLDGKQADKYKGQEAYDLWCEQVKAPLVPFVYDKERG